MREWIFSSAPAEKKRLVPRVRIEIEVGRFMFTLPNKDGF